MTTSTGSEFLHDFEWRGLVDQVTPDLAEALTQGTLTGYIGFDPTAGSLHVGSLLPVLALARLQRGGHRPIALLGGGTGLIGDPSGRTAERQLLSYENVEENVAGIREQLERFLDFGTGSGGAILSDNSEWLRPLNLMEFLRDTGKHFTVNQMVAKESVKRRLQLEEGISFTEFSYMLLQAYDFLELSRRHDCTLQLGGSDQWGNIVAGIDLIRRVVQVKAHGLVSPLVTNAAGTKFGKSEAGNVWLDPQLTSPYRFYQYWVNTDDQDAVRYLKYFTFLKATEIDDLAHELESRPERRQAQTVLAEELTRMTHGPAALERAQKVTGVFFGGDLDDVRAADLLESFDDAPTSDLDRSVLEEGIPLSDLLTRSGVAGSRNEGRRLIRGGGIYLNNRRAEEDRPVSSADAIEGRVLLLRKGKKLYHLVRLAEG